MLKLVYGMPRTGKTYYAYTEILKALSKERTVYLIVPDREVMEAERRIADRADKENVKCENLNVVSFRRLANIAFRLYGGIEYSYLSDGGKLMLIWKITEELTPVLKVYSKIKDKSLCTFFLSLFNELKRYTVTPSALSNAADNISDIKLKEKLEDISVIFAAYNALTSKDCADSSDDIERLAAILSKNNFLGDSLVFLDSFNGFTFDQLHVIEFLIKYCETTITLCKPETKNLTGFSVVEKTEQAILNIAEKHKIKVDNTVRLSNDNDYSYPEFKLIQNKLFDFSYNSDKDYYSDRISFASCSDRFSEAEFIASHIASLVEKGARYRDFAILTRNTDIFNGIFDVVFEKYGIPLFFSKRTNIKDTSLYSAVYFALKIISTGFKTEDIISYIKSGICDFSIYEIDLIESYTSLWSLTGKDWTNEFPWNMNPQGFNDITNETTVLQLELINGIRSKITSPLLKLKDSLQTGVPINSACIAVYNFLKDCGAYANISKSKDPEKVTVYNTFISVLETLVNVGDTITVNASVLLQLLDLVAQNTDFGAIPETFDCVVAGDASLMRANGRPHIILCACENGIFPKSASEDSCFSDYEKNILSSQGITLSPDTISKNDEEMFFFLRSACSASETLTVTYCTNNGTSEESVGFTRMRSLFPKSVFIKYPENKNNLDSIHSKETAIENTLASFGKPEYSAMCDALVNNGINLPAHRIPLCDRQIKLSTELTDKLFGKRLNLTQYRLEDYAKCPFSYYCKYILNLKEKKQSSYKSSDIGTYIHRILEKVISYIYSEKGENPQVSDTELENIIDKSANEVLKLALGEEFNKEGRFGALLLRLRKTLFIIIRNLLKEFENSSFKPTFFEMKIGGDEALSPLTVTLDDGTKLSVYGTVDRVDTFVKDDNAYIRVVDYKTGSRTHSLKNIQLGIDMQMLLYLFSFWKSDNKIIKNALHISENGKIIPAGVLYHSSNLKPTATSTPATSDEAKSLTEENLKRTGILLNDPSILDAMEHGIKGNYIPVSEKKNTYSMKGGELKSLEEMGELLSEVSDVLKRIGTEIKSGNASISPIKYKNLQSCSYCPLFPICRLNDYRGK